MKRFQGVRRIKDNDHETSLECSHSFTIQLNSLIFWLLFQWSIEGYSLREEIDNNMKIIDEIRSWLRDNPVQWYHKEIQALILRWRRS